MINELLKKDTIKLIVELNKQGMSELDIYKELNKQFIFQKKIAARKSLFGYVGGKQRLSPQIFQYMADHSVYVEPFFGSGAMFFYKGYKQVENNSKYKEVINDLDNSVSNFYEQLRDNTQELIDFVDNIEYSNTLYYKAKIGSDSYKECNNLKKAGYFFFNIYSSFSGYLNKSFSYSKINGTNKSMILLNKKLLLKAYSERLQSALIFNRTCKKIINTFDSKDTFFYLDPPYKNGIVYNIQKSIPFNFEEFVDSVNNIKGKWIVSHYDDDYINKFNYKTKIKLKHMNSCRYSPYIKKNTVGNECIIMNYDYTKVKLFRSNTRIYKLNKQK